MGEIVPRNQEPGSLRQNANLDAIQDRAHSMLYLTYFHGSLHSQITKFVPFSHFGTRLAACHAVARKLVEGAEGVPTLYHVRVLLVDSQFLDVEDWGTPHCIGLARKLRDSLEHEGDSSEMESLRAELVGRKQRRQEWRDYGFSKIASFLETRGARALRYPNVVEGLRDTISLCVISPSSIEILHAAPLEVAELEAATESLRIKIPPVNS